MKVQGLKSLGFGVLVQGFTGFRACLGVVIAALSKLSPTNLTLQIESLKALMSPFALSPTREPLTRFRVM